jgi:predicted AlkP superfamily phosphohydrolase/phosphomutase
MASRSEIRRVVVIGLDGLEPSIVAAMLDAGELPNFARLVGVGGLARVATTSPAQTPVAWSTFATGLNPGGHGIFDFIRRDPATYQPDLALNRHEQKSPWLPPRAVNSRGGTPVWDHLARSGRSSTILRCPCTYPASMERGRMLSGMGVPDLRGGLGTSTFYTTQAGVEPLESENVVNLTTPSRPGDPIATHLVGPRNPKDRRAIPFDFTIQPHAPGRSVTIQSRGEPAELVVREGMWSDWLRVRFKTGLLQSIQGMVRFYLRRIEPDLELYASPINFDPAAPPFPLSAPSTYADELSQEIGLFYTTGMVEDHAGLSNGRIDERAFLDQCELAWTEREVMMHRELDRFDEGLLYCLFDTPDRVQHMFWRFGEPDHPANRGRAVGSEYANVIRDQYRRADAIVGRALEFADDKTLVIALSDHGFGSFRRGFHVNTWLHSQGLLALKDDLPPGEAMPEFPACVDWSRTKAYALGLGGIYVNLAGREGQGIVKQQDAASLTESIAGGLTGLIDPELGSVAIRSAKTREALYSGPFAKDSPDLVVHYAEGYRVSWGASLGGVPAGHFEDNRKAWSGDHIIDPALVPGVLMMNRPFQGDGARLLDLAPTILDALGAQPVQNMEGRSLLQ